MFAALTSRLRSMFRFGRKGRFNLGIYGAPNAGKTLLANRMCEDWGADAMGTVSERPHETRAVERRTITLKSEDQELRIEVMDTPGIASSVATSEIEQLWNVPKEEALRRAKEATDGILEAIRHLSTVDGLLLVVDGSRDPRTQVSETLIAHVRGRDLPHVIIANKMDLASFDLARVKAAFPRSTVVPISAMTRKNLDAYYGVLLKTFK